MTISILAGISAIVLLICVYLLWRNEQVFRIYMKWIDEESAYKRTLLHKMAKENKLSEYPRNWERFKELPSQNDMVFKLWIPIETFIKQVKPINEYYRRYE